MTATEFDLNLDFRIRSPSLIFLYLILSRLDVSPNQLRCLDPGDAETAPLNPSFAGRGAR